MSAQEAQQAQQAQQTQEAQQAQQAIHWQSKSTEEQMNSARVLHQAGESKKAIDLLQAILEKEPNQMDVRELLGDIYFDCENDNEARRHYRYIYDRRRHAVDVALKLAGVYLSIPKKLRQAYNVYYRTVKYNPEHLQALLCYANFCRVLIREDEDVEQLYTKAEEICTLDLEKELELAAHYLETQQFPKALATLRRALLLTNQDSRIYHLFASIYFEMEEFEQATQYFSKTIALTGGSVQIYHELATLKIKQEKWAEATLALRQALDCCPSKNEEASLLQQLGVLLMKQEFYGDALQVFYQASALLPDDTNLLYALIAVQQKMMDYQAAITLLESQLLPKVGNQDKAARFLLANLYIMAQQARKAVEILDTLLTEEPKNADYHASLASAHLELGQKIQARKSLKSALRYNPHHATARSLHDNLNKENKEDEREVEKKKTDRYFDSLDLSEFFDQLGIEAAVEKLSDYLLHLIYKTEIREVPNRLLNTAH